MLYNQILLLFEHKVALILFIQHMNFISEHLPTFDLSHCIISLGLRVMFLQFRYAPPTHCRYEIKFKKKTLDSSPRTAICCQKGQFPFCILMLFYINITFHLLYCVSYHHKKGSVAMVTI